MAQSSGELDIDIKVTGLADLRSQLKAAKDDVVALQSADIIDPSKLAAATKRAGALKDALNDANEQIKVMSGGSDFEKVSNGLGLIGSQLKDMDFEGARNSAKGLTNIMKNMNPGTIISGFKDLAGTVLELGKAFMTMGIQLLANPIFLIVAIIVAVVVAIVLLKDKIKIVEVAFNMMMAPIKALIQGLKDLSDWLGLTSFAMEENADKAVAANNKKIASNEKVTASMDKEFAFQIALAKANGEDVTNMQIKQSQYDEVQAKARQAVAADTIKKLSKLQEEGKSKLSDEQKKAFKEANDNYVKERDLATSFHQDRIIIKATADTKMRDDGKKAGEKAASDGQKANKEAEDEQKRHIAVLRGLQDMIFANTKDGLDKDLAMNEEKLRRELEDLEKNEDIKGELKKKYIEQYKLQKQSEDNLAKEKDKKRLDDEVAVQKAAQDKQMADYKTYKKSLADAQSKYDDFMLGKSKDDEKKFTDALDKEYKTQEDNLLNAKQKELANVELSWIERMAIEAKYGAMLGKLQGQKAIDKKEHDDKVKEDEKSATAQKYQEIGAKVMEGLGAINGFLNQADSQRLSDIQSQHSSEISLLDSKQQEELSASNLSEAQKKNINDKYAKLKYQADLKAYNETEKIKKKQFVREKAMNLISTAMNIATGIMQIWGHSPDPTGISQTAMTAVIAGIGAIQLATIAAQKYQGESGPSAPTIGGAGGGASGGASNAAEPTMALYGKKSEQNTTQAGKSTEANMSFTVNAVVSETEITATQGRVGKMQKNAEL